jgi:iron complex transport system substrate-binding protein
MRRLKVSKYVLSGLFIVALVIAGLTGCGGEEGTVSLSKNDFIDQAGRTVHVENVPQRIVSLTPSNTEILFALNLGDRVVGVTDYCDYPPEAKTKTSIGGFYTPDIEKIISLSPDLVLAEVNHEAEVVPQLEKYGIPVIVLKALTIDEALAGITLVGEVTGNREEATSLVESLQDRIQRISDKIKGLSASEKPRVFYLTWHDPLITVGSKNIADDLITRAGGVNIFHSLEGFPTVSLEEIINANPDVIIAGVGMGTGGDATLEFALEESRLADTSARINNRVYSIDIDLIGRFGPRFIDALEELFAYIHPEL